MTNPDHLPEERLTEENLTEGQPADQPAGPRQEESTATIFGSDVDSLGSEALPDAPTPPSMRTMLLTVNSFRAKIPSATRAGLAIFIPGIIGYLLGYGTELLLVSGGAVSVINGENKPYAERWKSLLRYTLLFIVLTVSFRSLGIWAQNHGAIDLTDGLSGVIDDPKGTLIAYIPLMLFLIVSVISVYISMSLQLAPPGPYLMLFVTGGLLVNSIPISLTATLTWSLVGSAAAFVISMSGLLVNRYLPETNAIKAAEGSVKAYLSAVVDEDPAEIRSLQLAAAAAIHRGWLMLEDAGAVEGGTIKESAIGTPRADLVRRLLIAQQRWVTADPESSTLHKHPSDWKSIPLADPSPWQKLKRQWHWDSHPIATAIRVAIAGFFVAILSTVLGLGRPDWAITSVVLLLGRGPYRLAGTVRSIHRVAGAMVGILVYLAFYQLNPGILMDLFGLALAMFFVELMIAANYALAQVFTAPLGMMMAGIGDAPVGQIILDRGVEMALASLLVVATIWYVLPNNLQKTAEYNYQELIRASKVLLGTFRVRSVAESLHARQTLRYELNESRATTLACSKESAEWRNAQWARHAAAHVAAGDVLRAGAGTAHAAGTHVPEMVIKMLGERVDELK